MNKERDEKGYITLLSVLIVGAVVLATTLSLFFMGLNSSQIGFTYQKLAEARVLADACAEEALQQIRESTSFIGAGNLTLGGGSCAYEVIGGVGQSRTIEASSVVGEVVRRVKIEIDAINPTINIIFWQEVDDF